MTENNAVTPVLTDDEILTAIAVSANFDELDKAAWRPESLALGRAIESALLSKLRAPVADERALPPLPAAWGSAINDAGDGHVDLYSAEQLQDYARAALASAPVSGKVRKLPTINIGGKERPQQWFTVKEVRQLLDAAPQASEAVRDALMAFDEAMGLCDDFPELQHHRDALLFAVQKARAALSAQPGAQRTGGSDAG